MSQVINPLEMPQASPVEGRFFGKYRAFCRDNNDPEGLGRIRMEIPAVLGDGEENWSPWAWPSQAVGGNPDTGTYLIPDEGSGVWAEFEGGDPDYPIWAGVWFAGEIKAWGELPKEAQRICTGTTCLDCEDKLFHKNSPIDGPEHAKTKGKGEFTCPRRRVIYKSETGALFIVDDKDEEEFLNVIDRGGQILEMVTPVLRAANVGNGEARGERLATKGDQVPLSKVKDRRAFVRLTDLSRQFLFMDAWQDKERIILQSNDANRSRVQKIMIDTTKGKEKIILWGLNGNQSLVIDSTKGKESITLTDAAGQVLKMNAASGQEGVTVTDAAGQTLEMNAATGFIRAVDAAGSMLVMDGNSGIVTQKSANKTLINP